MNTTQTENTIKKNQHVIGAQVIQRNELPEIHSAIVDGQIQPLGIVKQFRKDPRIAAFITDNTERLSISWVHLKAGEALAVHAHPTKTFIIICEGQGYCIGDHYDTLEAGSIVMVEPNFLHGFCGAGDSGFWALSIQFEGDGLYEDQSQSRATFSNFVDEKPSMLHLKEAQDFFLNNYKTNDLFSVIEEANFTECYREPLLDNIQNWSHSFQDILQARLEGAGNDSIEKSLALEHAEEEENHDTIMADLRGNPSLPAKGPVNKEVTDWFCKAMLERSTPEKIVLMHLVLEGSGDYAHGKLRPFMEGLNVKQHFVTHEEDDEGHVQMGLDVLEKMDGLEYEKLLTTLMMGWVQLNRVCEEMAQLARRVGNSH